MTIEMSMSVLVDWLGKTHGCLTFRVVQVLLGYRKKNTAIQSNQMLLNIIILLNIMLNIYPTQLSSG